LEKINKHKIIAGETKQEMSRKVDQKNETKDKNETARAPQKISKETKIALI